MVALTSNLVMYTLYHSIQDKLPEDSSIKLIDIWLLHGLLMPMVVFVTLAANELIHPKAHKFSNIKIANSAVKVPRRIDQTPPKKKQNENLHTSMESYYSNYINTVHPYILHRLPKELKIEIALY